MQTTARYIHLARDSVRESAPSHPSVAANPDGLGLLGPPRDTGPYVRRPLMVVAGAAGDARKILGNCIAAARTAPVGAPRRRLPQRSSLRVAAVRPLTRTQTAFSPSPSGCSGLPRLPELDPQAVYAAKNDSVPVAGLVHQADRREAIEQTPKCDARLQERQRRAEAVVDAAPK